MSDSTMETFKVGDGVFVVADISDDFDHDFTGTIVSVLAATYMVEDQDGDVFECLPTQLFPDDDGA